MWCGWEAQLRAAYDPGAIDTRPDHTLMEKKKEVEAPRHGAANTAPGLNPHLSKQEEIVEKHSGRHRKRRQGWGEHLRWALGAVLAAVFCSPTGQSSRPVVEVRKPLSARRLVEGREPDPGWPAGQVRTQVPRPRDGAAYKGPHATAPARRRGLYTGRRGWCEDDDGVRGVRLYLAVHEKNQHARRQVKAVPPAPRHEGSVPGAAGGGGEPPLDMSDLAAVVRQWQALRQPVA